jgi:hypothetical protein
MDYTDVKKQDTASSPPRSARSDQPSMKQPAATSPRGEAGKHRPAPSECSAELAIVSNDDSAQDEDIRRRATRTRTVEEELEQLKRQRDAPGG